RPLPPACFRADARSGRARTSPTSRAWDASSRSGRGAGPFRGGALLGARRPWPVLLLPFAAGKPLLDLLEQPAVPVRILERGKREVGTTFRVAPAAARVLHGVVARAAGVVEDLANVDATGD